MSTKVILLMGAPTTQSLQWDESELLNAPVAPFHDPGDNHKEPWPFPEDHPVKWRLLYDQPIIDQPYDDIGLGRNNDTPFFTTEGLKETVGEDSVLSQFYDHSFAVHETSEVSVPGSFSGDPSLHESTDSGPRAASTTDSSAISSNKQILLPINGPVSALQDVPSASYLRSIVPQTVTVNLIVGIITVQAPRRVVTRQWKRELDIIEMVVGDETGTGFAVTFWLPPSPRGSGDNNNDIDELGRSLDGLRPRDIVLLRMVGLSSFQERVYGQSLRKGVTQVNLLHRKRADTTDPGGIYGVRHLNANRSGIDPVVDKVRRVREWIRCFVNADTAPEPAGGDGSAKMYAMKYGQTLLPPDTQETI